MARPTSPSPLPDKPASKPVFFASPEAFRGWFAQHAASASELVVGFHKRDSGLPSITWPQSVDEALCVGWIDGVRKNIDETSYQIRFTPRKASSIWSAVNIARVAALTAQGRMKPAGLEAFARRTEGRSRTYAYEQTEVVTLAPAEEKQFRKDKAAWAFFEKQAPSYCKRMLWWIVGARQDVTREKRLAALIEASSNLQRL